MKEANIDQSEDEDIEGWEAGNGSWGDYPIDEVLIRHENRTIHDVMRRIDQGGYVMDPDFQRDFIWDEKKQSKLIESVVMRVPLPVFYLAEDDEGRMVVVDGLQRLSTFQRFLQDELKLVLPDRPELKGYRFSELPNKIKNRVEDCNLIFYIIDSKVPEQARLDIFERVNGGIPLTRQQMRNCLFMGDATLFLKEESQTDEFLRATGHSLNKKTMRDREFVNRFCAFSILELDSYRGDMDDFLAQGLREMNAMSSDKLAELSTAFRRGLAHNLNLFGKHAFRKHAPGQESRRPLNKHAFRKHAPGQESRRPLNASLWDVLSTGMCNLSDSHVQCHADEIRGVIYGLLKDDEFNTCITYGPNDARKVRKRFAMVKERLQEAVE